MNVHQWKNLKNCPFYLKVFVYVASCICTSLSLLFLVIFWLVAKFILWCLKAMLKQDQRFSESKFFTIYNKQCEITNTFDISQWNQQRHVSNSNPFKFQTHSNIERATIICSKKLRQNTYRKYWKQKTVTDRQGETNIKY